MILERRMMNAYRAGWDVRAATRREVHLFVPQRTQRFARQSGCRTGQCVRDDEGRGMIIIGVVLLVIGYSLGLTIFQAIGLILLVIGLIFLVLGSVDAPLPFDRRWWY
jgi:hypothetical protein